MEIKGKIIQQLVGQSGIGKKGQWRKQEYIVETVSQYPKKICIGVWGDKIDQFALRVGDSISAAVELESREYNGKWYTEVRAWKCEKTAAVQMGGQQQSQPISKDEPFYSTEMGGSDDLPF